ncbi:MAG: hypothetical protein WAS21_17400 [Geminicoccaceae bacterium]
MPAARSPAQQAAAHTNGARSRGPTTDAGKARSSRNGTHHGLRGGLFALLAGEDREAFAELHAAVTADWGPRDAYEHRWVMELVASMWRQDRLRGLELATLTVAATESPPTEATVRKLTTFARYGARIDKDIGRALQALRVLRNRPDAWIDALQNDTPEPEPAEPQVPSCANEAPPCTLEPEIRQPRAVNGRVDLAMRTPEPEPDGAVPAPTLNRHQRRRLEALARKRHAA